jgi:crotonobetainyl-CoA:carnitine CoA-transferase CaiB-like acyl-CoA transferase
VTFALPLDGVRVLSLAEQYPGPYATLILADLGADVVLVERPRGGDPTRAFPDFFEALNRSKRSVALDLKSEDGRAAFLRLVESADVLLEGFRPGAMARLGLGYEDVAAVNPSIVYVSISGFGQDGPACGRAAHDLSYQAIAGVLYDVLDREPGESHHLQLADLSSGLFATIAALSGLVARAATGVGSYFDLAMTDCLVSLMTTQLFPVLNGTGLGPAPFLDEPAYRLYRTADGRLLSLSIAHEDPFWRALCEATGLDDAASLGAEERWSRRDELIQRLAEAIAQRTLDEWVDLLVSVDVPCAPVHSLAEVAEDPQVRHRGQIVRIGGGEAPPRLHVAQPIRVDGRVAGPRARAPQLGENTDELVPAIDPR